MRELVGDPAVERVLMLTQPRVLGYVFNPVMFYWCYRGDGSGACVVAELNNTVGERLPEVLRGAGPSYEHGPVSPGHVPVPGTGTCPGRKSLQAAGESA